MGPKPKPQKAVELERGQKLLASVPPDEAASIREDAGELVDAATYLRWLETGKGDPWRRGSSE